jgi:protein-disulfide isomerase
MRKKYIKIFAIIFLLALIIVVAVFYITNKDRYKNEKPVNEVSALVENNQAAIAKARNAGLKVLRSIDEADHVWGEASAPVEIIMYNNFASPFGSQYFDTLKKVKKEFSGKVKIAFRQYCHNSDFNAMDAAIASECAGEQGKFWEMHDRLISDNIAGTLNSEYFQKKAEEANLDLNKFNECFGANKSKEKIIEQVNEARDYGIIGTPTIIVDGVIFSGAYPFEDFIDSAGVAREGVKSVIERQLGQLKVTN